MKKYKVGDRVCYCAPGILHFGNIESIPNKEILKIRLDDGRRINALERNIVNLESYRRHLIEA